MKNKIVILLISLCATSAITYAQDDETEQLRLQIEELSEKVSSLQSSYFSNRGEITKLKSALNAQKKEIDSLRGAIATNNAEIKSVQEQSETGLSETNKNLSNTSVELSSAINHKSVYASLVGFIALIVGIVIFFIYKKKSSQHDREIDSFEDKLAKLESDRVELDSNLLGTNSKVLDLIERQLSLPQVKSTTATSGEEDHSLAIAVANELIRIQQNLNHMDPSVKGVSQLKNRAKAIMTTLNSKQYEVPDLLGAKYHDGDNMVATMELNEELDAGVSRIKRVIKPQVSFKGKMIQAAEVVVEFNE